MPVAQHTGQPLGTHHKEAGWAHGECSEEPLERSIQEQGGEDERNMSGVYDIQYDSTTDAVWYQVRPIIAWPDSPRYMA